MRNISNSERWGSMLGGAALTLYGLSRFRRGGWIVSAFGALLFRRGARGQRHTYELQHDLERVSTAEGSSMLAPHGDPLSDQLRRVREG